MVKRQGWPHLSQFDGAVELYTIHDRPTDYPDHFVVRRLFIQGVDFTVFDVVPRIGDTLEEAREYIPEGFVRMGRRYGDDAFILETWMEPRIADALWTDA